jgi:hypothetical protein
MRHTFCGDLASWVMDLGGSETASDGNTGYDVLVIPGQPVTFWDSPVGGTQLTDLLDAAGDPVTGVTSDAGDGSVPQVSGPDGVTSMWADAAGGSGPRRVVAPTDTASLVDGLAAQQAADAAQVQAVSASSPVYIYYNTVTGSWPSRPAGLGQPVWWVGPVAPEFGGSYAVDGLDYWVGPQ